MTLGQGFHFGEFTLDLEARQLLEQARVIHLSSKAFDLLQILLDQRPRVVSKQYLNDRLWPHTFVSEVNLATLVAELRRALRDDAASPRYIRTVHRHGYAFSGTATEHVPRSQTALEPLGTHWIAWEVAKRVSETARTSLAVAVAWQYGWIARPFLVAMRTSSSPGPTRRLKTSRAGTGPTFVARGSRRRSG